MIKKCIVLLLLLSSTGCMMQQKATVELNPIVKNPEFIEAFQHKTIKMVAPASGVDSDKIEALRTLPDLNIVIPENTFGKVVAYHSNTDEQRFALLKKALFDPSKNTIIWTLRGGYGSGRLIEKLNKLPKPKTQKTFIGSSDITALHLFLSQKWQWKTIHGAGLVSLASTEINPENFRLIGEIIKKRDQTKPAPMIALNDLTPMNSHAAKAKKISGRLTGGNLSIVQTSIGTSWQIKTAGKIVFLEEIGEKGYRIDRTLEHLKQAGLFKNVKALVFGEFLNGDEHVAEALERFAKDNKIPIFKSNQFGHGSTNYPLIYQTKSEIIVNKATKTFLLRSFLKG